MFRTGLILAIILLLAAPSSAQVYEWIDENGVKRYSNVAPGESATEVRQTKEDKGGASSAPSPASSPRPAPGTEPAAPSNPPAQPPPDNPAAGGSEGAGEKAAPEETVESVVEAVRLDIAKFPITQDQLLTDEADRLESLKKKYEEMGLSRQERVAAERMRLMQAISDLSQAPLPKYGSQDNKRRQVGYYRYRLEDLQDSPEEYFQGAADSGEGG